MLIVTLILPSIITVLCWFGVVANIKNEYHGSVFSNGWLFNPEQLEPPGLKYRLAIIVISPIWFFGACYYYYWR